MSFFYHILIPFVVSMFASIWIFPKVLRIALMKNIVDNPDARKLQRVPVPVLGGVAVVFGVLVSLMLSCTYCDCSSLFAILLAMLVMLYVGTIDDIMELSPGIRFVIEILLVLMLIFICGYSINDFHGLWGVHTIPTLISVPLTLLSVVGIINAINLIDGVDGYSSGYCIMVCAIFGTVFYLSGDRDMVVLAAVCAASLLPFFFHNVFGRKSKMFIGDGGTLVMGIVMSIFVLNILKHDTSCNVYCSWGIGLVPFTLAVLSIPVFDTVRVMSTRIMRRTSPFHPDKTHLHHLFISMGFSHIGTTVCILMLNLLVVASWFIVYKLGAGVDLQFYIVILMSFLVTFGFYGGMRWCQKHRSPLWSAMCRLGKATHVERKGFFLWLQHLMDGK